MISFGIFEVGGGYVLHGLDDLDSARFQCPFMSELLLAVMAALYNHVHVAID